MLNPLREKIKTCTGGGEGTTLVVMACPEAGRHNWNTLRTANGGPGYPKVVLRLTTVGY